MRRSIYSKSAGDILITVVVSLSVLLGAASLILDLGPGYMARADLQKAVDAAALAGAESLPDTRTAAQVAIETAMANYPEGRFMIAGLNPTYIKIRGERTIEYFAAKMIGIDSSLVEAEGTARVEYPYSVEDVVPFGVQDQIFLFGWPYALKYGPHSGEFLPLCGNYGALALGGTGASNYKEKIKYGYHGMLCVGQWISTEPGNMSGPTNEGVHFRISLDPHSNYLTVDKYSPRLITVPIIRDYQDVQGSDEVQISGFGLFFLEGTGGSGNDNYVIGRFLQRVRPTLESGTAAPNYGMRDVKLYSGATL